MKAAFILADRGGLLMFGKGEVAGLEDGDVAFIAAFGLRFKLEAKPAGPTIPYCGLEVFS